MTLRNIKLLCLLSVFVWTSVFAGDRVRRVAMHDSTGNEPEQPIWVSIDSSGSARSVWIYLDAQRSTGLVQYTGFSTLTMNFDTTTTDVAFGANLDTVAVTITYLNYDQVDSQYEEPSQPAAGDTTHIKTAWRWSVTHSDSKFQLSKVLNFRTGFDAAKVTVTPNQATDAFRFRAKIDHTEDR